MTSAPSIGAAPGGSFPERGLAAAVARAPGKLILMGEHAVVYGEPALVCALGLHLDARIESAMDRAVVIRLPAIPHSETTDWNALAAEAAEAERRWRAFAADPAGVPFSSLGGSDAARLARIALGEVARSAAPPLPGCRVIVDADLPAGSGFGSSAALAVALIAACRAAFALPWDDARLEALALDVERRQHGIPSGVDGATVLRGGVVWAERSSDGGLAVAPVRPDPEHLARFRVLHTGAPRDSTGEIVAAVRARVEREGPHARARLARMGATTREFRRVIEGGGGPADVIRLVRAYQADLDALGVVPERVRALVAAVESLGGAAKVSGAGGLAEREGAEGGAGSVLAYHADPAVLRSWTPPPGTSAVDAPLGAEGVRVIA